MRTTLTLFAVLLAVGALQARVRELEPRALHEGETVYLTVPGAERARVSNAAVLSAACREGGEAELSGLRLGTADVTFFGATGPAATLRVDVRPAYWEMLGRLFADDPEIRAEVAGDRVILTGSTADVGALRRVREAVALDPERIVSHVSVSPEALKALLDAFLRRNGQEGVAAELVGQEVCLSGKMYDQGQIDALGKKVQAFLADFPGLTVNTGAMRVYKQKILIGIEFLSYDSTLARNLGVEISDAVGADFDLTYTIHDNLSGTIRNSDGLTARINTRRPATSTRPASPRLSTATSSRPAPPSSTATPSTSSSTSTCAPPSTTPPPATPTSPVTRPRASTSSAPARASSSPASTTGPRAAPSAACPSSAASPSSAPSSAARARTTPRARSSSSSPSTGPSRTPRASAPRPTPCASGPSTCPCPEERPMNPLALYRDGKRIATLKPSGKPGECFYLGPSAWPTASCA